jgi:deoxyribose-phosphate aldolase
MDIRKILSKCDHTLLRPDSTWAEIRRLCDEGVRYGVASVCIPPSFVRRAADYLAGRLPVCTVIGFPNGYSAPSVKAAEARQAVADGADELDMVVNLGLVKDGQFDAVLEEILLVRTACPGKILKVIIETCLLTEAEKIRLCTVVSASGADFIKTSTGFSTGGATAADVALLRRHTDPAVKVKAAGGIAALADAEQFLALGADRLGTSRIVKLAAAQGL